jgi:hypothetical protein
MCESHKSYVQPDEYNRFERFRQALMLLAETSFSPATEARAKKVVRELAEAYGLKLRPRTEFRLRDDFRSHVRDTLLLKRRNGGE